jgi:Tol biopolymer transport system component
VWTLGSEGKGEIRRVADFGGIASWSPDGAQLIIVKSLTTRVDQDTKTENWRFNADGSGATKLPIPETDQVGDWSPDGRWLVTVSDRHPPHHQGYQIYIMRPDGTEQRRMTEGGLNLVPRFSPDGRRIAYLHAEGGENGIWVVDVDGGGRRRVIGREIGLSASPLCWSPDGKSIAYTIKDLQQDEQGQWSIKSFELAIIDAEGKGVRTLKLPPAKYLGHPGDWR